MSKYFITGGGGMVASHFIDLLLENKEEVICSIRWNEDLSRTEHFKEKVKFVYMDLNDEISILRALAQYKPDYISHLAAQSFVNYGYDVPIETINTNTLGTVKLLEAVRFIKEFI